MPRPLRALIVEDSEDDAELLLRELRRQGYDPDHTRVQTPAALQAALDKQTWDVVLSDYQMPSFTGVEAMELVRKRGLEVPFIIISGTIGEDVAVEAMKAGVHDYIIKGKLARLAPALERELRDSEARRKRREAEEALRKKEAQLLQAQKMEAVGRLAGGVAHDFNNLLTAILGYSELSLQSLSKTDPLRQDWEEVKKCAQRAGSLTRQLLAFSRQQVLAPKALDLNAILKDVAKLLRRLIGEDVTLTLDLAADLDVIKADPGQLEQVIMNLAVNARDAMPDGGTLSLKTSNAALTESHAALLPEIKPGPYAMLTVNDTGEGMDNETLGRIFEPFFTTKPQGKGTGLGLATVYGIVKQTGGHVFVESAKGKGTIFRIYLPRAEGSAQAAEPEIKEPKALRGSETILLVEDEETLRQMTRRILTRNGYKVLDAANAGEALLICEKNKGDIHLMLTDIVMPHMDGRDLAQRLASLRPAMRVAYMTGHVDPEILKKEILDPGKPLLRKPFLPNDLMRLVRQVLDAPSVPR